MREVSYKHTVFAKPLYFCKLAGSLTSQGKKSGTTPKPLQGPSLRHSLLSEMQTLPSSTTRGYFPWLKLPPRAPTTRSQRIQLSFSVLCRTHLMPSLPFGQMAQDRLVPALLFHLLRLKGAALVICLLFAMFHFFFFTQSCVFTDNIHWHFLTAWEHR